MYVEIGWENLKERDRLEDLGIGGRIIFEWILKTSFVRVWPGLIWLRTGTGGGVYTVINLLVP